MSQQELETTIRQDQEVKSEIPATETDNTAAVNGEAISLLNGIFVGAATVLVLNTKEGAEKDSDLEDRTVEYLKRLTSSYVRQGITRDNLGFLFSQMSIAVEASPDNLVQQVAHYLFGLVLESSEPAKAS